MGLFLPFFLYPSPSDPVQRSNHRRPVHVNEARRENLSQANKLCRTYALLLDALNRHRGKGQQKVTVEHVHVNAGGQAIVGVVPSPKVNSKKLEEEADAARAIAHAPDTALRCSDPEREAVPIASGARETPL
jgi:hypothetical protein